MLRSAAILFAAVSVLAGCDPGPQRSTGGASAGPGMARKAAPRRVQDLRMPEITTEAISRDVVGWAVEVSEATGSGPNDKWTFEADEYRRIDILETRAGESALEILVFMLTRDNPRPGDRGLQVFGRVRLRYEWRDERWVLRHIENLTFQYTIGIAT
jgi:hypothetical protein